MEFEEAAHRAFERRHESERGKNFDPNRYASMSYGPEWEAAARSLPTLKTYAAPLQYPDGRFVFMLDVDSVGGSPLG